MGIIYKMNNKEENNDNGISMKYKKDIGKEVKIF